MYSTCLFCNASLGHNEAIEHFPVGRRLAYDAAKGRLWVVCRACERWNLTPLEERWEAIEEAERAFRATRLRVSTDQIGLARLRDGLELVRIGAPQRPEMAAWRYGDQFGRRTRRNVVLGACGLAAAPVLLWGGPAIGLAGGVVSAMAVTLQVGAFWDNYRRPVARVRVGDGSSPAVVRLAHAHVVRTTLHTDGPDGWSLEVPFLGSTARVVHTKDGPQYLSERILLHGELARQAVTQILPRLNDLSRASTVQAAVGLLASQRSVGDTFRNAALMAPDGRWFGKPAAPGRLWGLPKHVRLALEMAAHEENERLALEGELHLLADAWRDAEEIAAIADDMFLPPAVDDALLRIKQQPGGRST